MNSDKHRPAGASGNAMIYILLALALLGGLTMVLSRGASIGGDDLSADKTELLTTRMVAYAAAAKNSVDQMMMSGTLVANLDFLQPQDTGFDTGPFLNRVYHPRGGGLSPGPTDPAIFSSTDTNPSPGWYMGRFNNIEWTPTAANDVVLAAYGVSEALCQNLNKKITGNTTIPVVGDYAEELFIDPFYGGWGTSDLTEAVCPGCEGWPSLCVSDGNDRVYYNIISAQ